MDRETLAHVDLGGRPVLAGRLWTHLRRGRESATFAYEGEWLQHPARFSLEPALRLGPGPFHTPEGLALFGALGDSAPDRWGRTLMRRQERRRADAAGETPRTLGEIDFLLGVDDAVRIGALRFSYQKEGPFLASGEGHRIPPVMDLPRLLTAADHVAADAETEEDMRLLLAPGSSLGGVRPKAMVVDSDGSYAIAKFPRAADETDVVRWEGVALMLAADAGIDVPRWRLESVGKRTVLLSTRFDRPGGSRRVPFLSALSMLGALDREQRSYMEIADALRLHGSNPKEALRQLWRRLVFNICIANTDDHLRNHGFLYDGTVGWRLAPAYDLNPVPMDIGPRVLSTAIDLEDGTGSIERALAVSDYFGLELAGARGIVAEVGTSVRRWRQAARSVGIGPREIDRMASAFLEED